MGMFDELKKKAEKAVSDHPELKEKAQNYLAEHPDMVEKASDQAIDRGGDAVDPATGGKYADKVDRAQRTADEKVSE